MNKAQVDLINQIEAADKKQAMANRKARALMEVGEKRRADKAERKAEAERQKLLTPPAVPATAAAKTEPAQATPPASQAAANASPSFEELMRQRRAERETQQKELA